MSGQFGTIRGDAGVITASAGAKVGVISKWVIVPSRMKEDGRPELQFKAQFGWKQDSLMAMIGRGALKGRVTVQMRNRRGQVENIDIVSWGQWRYDNGILYLDDIVHFENVRFNPLKRT